MGAAPPLARLLVTTRADSSSNCLYTDRCGVLCRNVGHALHRPAGRPFNFLPAVLSVARIVLLSSRCLFRRLREFAALSASACHIANQHVFQSCPVLLTYSSSPEATARTLVSSAVSKKK